MRLVCGHMHQTNNKKPREFTWSKLFLFKMLKKIKQEIIIFFIFSAVKTKYMYNKVISYLITWNSTYKS